MRGRFAISVFEKKAESIRTPSAVSTERSVTTTRVGAEGFLRPAGEASVYDPNAEEYQRLLCVLAETGNFDFLGTSGA